MRNQKGITIVSLIITIAVIIILTGSTINLSMNRFKINNLKKMQNDIELLNDKIENYYLKIGGLPILKQNDNLITYTYSGLNFAKNANDNNNYYIIDLEVIGNITLNYGKEGYEHPNTSDDVYILNEKTRTVYYVKGVEGKDGNIYHSLSFDNTGNGVSVGVTKPEINILKKGNEYFEVEIIPGKDNISGVQKTEYKITSTDIENVVTEGETTQISERTVIGNLEIDKAHEIEVTTTSANESHSTTTTNTIINKWIKDLDIGDYVNYSEVLPDVTLANDSQVIIDLTDYSGNTDTTKNTPDTISQEKTLTWKVLDIKDGKLRLISSVPTASKIRLYGANGYNNVVYLLDELCDTLYSSNKGKAQNLKIEDIEGHLTYNYKSYSDSNAAYGGSKQYTTYIQYPNIYPNEVGCIAVATADNAGNMLGLSEQTTLVTGSSNASNRLKATQTYWSKSLSSSDFTNSGYYTLFINNGSSLDTYWLSSRCVLCRSDGAGFGARYVKSGSVDRYGLFFSRGNNYSENYAFRPVITLNSDVEIGEKVNDVWQINN